MSLAEPHGRFDVLVIAPTMTSPVRAPTQASALRTPHGTAPWAQWTRARRTPSLPSRGGAAAPPARRAPHTAWPGALQAPGDPSWALLEALAVACGAALLYLLRLRRSRAVADGEAAEQREFMALLAAPPEPLPPFVAEVPEGPRPLPQVVVPEAPAAAAAAAPDVAAPPIALPAHLGSLQPLWGQGAAGNAPAGYPPAFRLYLTAFVLRYDPRWQRWWTRQRHALPREWAPAYRGSREVRKGLVRARFRSAVAALSEGLAYVPAPRLLRALERLVPEATAEDTAERADMAAQMALLFALLDAEQQKSCRDFIGRQVAVEGVLPPAQPALPASRVAVTLADGFRVPQLMTDAFVVYDGAGQRYALLAERDLLLRQFERVLQDGGEAGLYMENYTDPITAVTRWSTQGALHPFSVAGLRPRAPTPAPPAWGNRRLRVAAAALAAAAAGALVLPLECVKVRQQLFGVPAGAAARGLAASHGLWRGFGPHMCSALVLGGGLLPVLEPWTSARPGAAAAAGAGARARLAAAAAYCVVGAAVVAPWEVAKVRLLAHPQWTQDWVWVVAAVLREGGPGLHKGWALLAARTAWGALAHVACHAALARAARGGRRWWHPRGNWGWAGLQGALVGAATVAAVQGLDTVFTVANAGPGLGSAREAFDALWAARGWGGLWAGAGVQWAAVAVTLAVRLLLYERCKDMMYRGLLQGLA